MRQSPLPEIAEWNTEAKLEDNARYFFHVAEVGSIQAGVRSYVLGRKGSGKTAISEHLHGRRDYNVFSQKLTFKNFPLRDLYDLHNSRYPAPNQYITLWKYLIYSSIAKQISTNEVIDNDVRSVLARVYADDPETSLPRTIGRWTSRNFGLNVLGSGGAGSATKVFTAADSSWIDRVEILERLLEEHLDDSKYMVLFDELDEDYKDIASEERHSEYNALLTGLFKAVQDVKTLFPRRRYDVVPVVFLRDDIFDQLQDSDRTKWRDLAITLDWSESVIKAMLAHRITRAADATAEPLPFDNAWLTVFCGHKMKTKKGRRVEPFKQMSIGSHGRPRDFIKFLQLCAKDALARRVQCVSAEGFRAAQQSYSNYLRGELEDEIHPILPEIPHLFNVIATIRKEVFTTEEFSAAYRKGAAKGLLPLRDIETVLGILFQFSVIGTQARNKDITFFRTKRPSARLNLDAPLVVHPGLLKAVPIF